MTTAIDLHHLDIILYDGVSHLGKRGCGRVLLDGLSGFEPLTLPLLEFQPLENV